MPEEVLRRIGQDMRKETGAGTFGIEFEINNVRTLRRELPKGWKYTGDISVESKGASYNGKPLEISSKKKYFERNIRNFGIEIVSPILGDFDELLDVLDNIKETGIKTDSKDCGIHVHVSYPKGDSILSLFRLALKYEPLFYAIGSFGKFSRGKFKNYIYQRPLMYPPIVKVAKRSSEGHYFGHSFDISNFKNVENEKDFRTFLGAETSTKYHGSKYCGINFYSYFHRSTVEIRTFNITTNYNYLKAAINFARDFVFAGIKEYYLQNQPEDLEINFINDLNTDDLLYLFQDYSEKYTTFMDREDILIIQNLIRNSPKITIPEKVMFHLLYHRNGDNSRIQHYSKKELMPEKVSVEDAIKPKAERRCDYDFKGDLCAN